MHSPSVLAVALAAMLALATAAPLDMEDPTDFGMIQTDEFDDDQGFHTHELEAITDPTRDLEEDHVSRGYRRVHEEHDLIDEDALLAPLRQHAEPVANLQMMKDATDEIARFDKLIADMEKNVDAAKEESDQATAMCTAKTTIANGLEREKETLEGAVGDIQARLNVLLADANQEWATRQQEVAMLNQVLAKVDEFIKCGKCGEAKQTRMLENLQLTAETLLALNADTVNAHPDMHTSLLQLKATKDHNTANQIKELLTSLRNNLMVDPRESQTIKDQQAALQQKTNEFNSKAAQVTPAKNEAANACNAKTEKINAHTNLVKELASLQEKKSKAVEEIHRDVDILGSSSFSGDMVVKFQNVAGDNCADGKSENCRESKIKDKYDCKGLTFPETVVSKDMGVDANGMPKGAGSRWAAACGEPGEMCNKAVEFNLKKNANRVGFVPLGDFDKLEVVVYGTNDKVLGKKTLTKEQNAGNFIGFGAVGNIRRVKVFTPPGGNGRFALGKITYDGFSAAELQKQVEELKDKVDEEEKKKEETKEEQERFEQERKNLAKRLEDLGLQGNPQAEVDEIKKKSKVESERNKRQLKDLAGTESASTADNNAKEALKKLANLDELQEAAEDAARALENAKKGTDAQATQAAEAALAQKKKALTEAEEEFFEDNRQKLDARKQQLANDGDSREQNEDKIDDRIDIDEVRKAAEAAAKDARQKLAETNNAENKAAAEEADKHLTTMNELARSVEKDANKELRRTAEDQKKVEEIIAEVDALKALEAQLKNKKDNNDSDESIKATLAAIRSKRDKIIHLEEARKKAAQEAEEEAVAAAKAKAKVILEMNKAKREQRQKLEEENSTLRDAIGVIEQQIAEKC